MDILNICYKQAHYELVYSILYWRNILMSKFMTVYEPTQVITESMLEAMMPDYDSYQSVTEGFGSVVKMAWEYIKKFFKWLFEKIKTVYYKIKSAIKKLLGIKDDKKDDKSKQEPKKETKPEEKPASEPEKPKEEKPADNKKPEPEKVEVRKPEPKPEPKEEPKPEPEPEKVEVHKPEPKPEPKEEPKEEPKPEKQLFPVTIALEFNHDNPQEFDNMVEDSIRTCTKFVTSMKSALSSIKVNKDNPEETELPSTIDLEELGEQIKELRDNINGVKGDYKYEFNSVDEVREFLETLSKHCVNLRVPASAAFNLVDGVCKSWDIFEFAIRDKIDPEDKIRRRYLVKHLNNKCKLIWSWFDSMYTLARDIGGVCGNILTGFNADNNHISWWIWENVES